MLSSRFNVKPIFLQNKKISRAKIVELTNAYKTPPLRPKKRPAQPTAPPRTSSVYSASRESIETREATDFV